MGEGLACGCWQRLVQLICVLGCYQAVDLAFALFGLVITFSAYAWNPSETPRLEEIGLSAMACLQMIECKDTHLIVHETLRSLPLSQQCSRRQQRLRLHYRRAANIMHASWRTLVTF